jgi:hypothetical protein
MEWGKRVADESNTIRIGMQGTQTATFIAGINGVNASAGSPVYILSTGQLGTRPAPPVASTSAGTTVPVHFKEEMKAMKATIAKQQKQIEALTAGLQKVSAQLELSKPEPQTVLNNR